MWQRLPIAANCAVKGGPLGLLTRLASAGLLAPSEGQIDPAGGWGGSSVLQPSGAVQRSAGPETVAPPPPVPPAEGAKHLIDDVECELPC